MKCGGHALIRGATPAGLGGVPGTRAKRAAGARFVPGDDPDLTYGAELVKVRCPLSPSISLSCVSQWGREGGERERGFYLITMRYVILLSSEQTYHGPLAGRRRQHNMASGETAAETTTGLSGDCREGLVMFHSGLESRHSPNPGSLQ